MSTIIDTLVTKRTGGYYNLEDLNRVGGTIQYLAVCLAASHVGVTVQPKTDYTLASIPDPALLLQVLTDIKSLWAAVEEFTATVQQPSPSYGFYSLAEQIVLGDIIDVTAINGMLDFTVTLAAADCSQLVLSGEGWAVTRSGTSVTARYQYACGEVKDTAQIFSALRLSFNGSDPAKVSAEVTATLSATGRSGKAYAAAGSALIKYASNCWTLAEAKYSTWGAINGTAWSEIQQMEKPT